MTYTLVVTVDVSALSQSEATAVVRHAFADVTTHAVVYLDAEVLTTTIDELDDL